MIFDKKHVFPPKEVKGVAFSQQNRNSIKYFPLRKTKPAINSNCGTFCTVLRKNVFQYNPECTV